MNHPTSDSQHRSHTTRSPRPKWADYVLVVVLETALTAGLLALDRYTPVPRFPAPYVLMIMGVAFLLGEGPAILAFFLGFLAYEGFFVPPVGTLWPLATTPQGWAALVEFLIITAVAGVGALAMRATRRRAEGLAQTLHEASQRLAFHVENSPLAVIEFDPEFRITRWTEEAERMFGWRADEVLGKRIADLRWVYEEDQDAVARVSEGMADGTAPRNVSRNRNYHKDGSVIHSVWHNSALLDESGKLVSILSLVLDMTEETRLRQRLTHQVELLQRALMPSPPSLGDGYAAAAAYLPAFAGEEIGGDFYDSFETEDGKIGFVIGDVCGKGLGAASLAATSRNTVRAFAYDTLSAGESLSHTNTVLCAQEADPSRFVTVFVIILDPSNGTMNYASAGHPPAAVRRANGAVEFLGTDNLPVCILDKLDFESAQSSLSPGDKIVLYTDGILEARRGSEFFELEGVRRTLLEHGHKSPAELTNEMLQAAKDWSGGRLKDDVAILVVERTK